MVSYLFLEAIFVLGDHLPDHNKTTLFLFEVTLELISLCELVLNFIFHLVDAFSDLLQFVVNTVLQVFDLL